MYIDESWHIMDIYSDMKETNCTKIPTIVGAIQEVEEDPEEDGFTTLKIGQD